MAEDIAKITGSKEMQYQGLLPLIAGILEGETDLTANLANTAAMLHTQFGWWWTGFYWVRDGQLVLAPFQGPVACTRIQLGKGVCGTAWAEKRTVIVPNVHEFPGHIACSADSQSEIVVPVIRDGSVVGVLDVDSADLNTFDALDQYYLEKIAALIPC